MQTNFRDNSRQINLLVALWEQFQLMWRLLFDARVPLMAKFAPIVSLVLLISPIDLIPDFLIGFFGLGALDDLALLAIGMRLIIALAPKHLVEEHLAAIRGESSPRPSVTTTYRVVNE